MFDRKIIVLLVVIGSGLLSGCDQLELAQPNNDTLLVDFTAVIRATGKDVQVENQLVAANQNLELQLVQAAQDLNKQLADAKAEIGDEPTLEQQQELEQLSVQVNQRMNEVQQLARQKSQQVQVALINQLRDQVRPIAESIARTRGAKAVLMNSEPVLWFDASIDITADVIAQLRANPETIAPIVSDVEPTTGSPEAEVEKAVNDN